MRNLIRGYFDTLGDVDYVSELKIPEATPEQEAVESEEDNDDTEIHFTGEDDE
jgi:hypothetical protein